MSRNLLPNLIQIYTIQWWFSFVFYVRKNKPFLANMLHNSKIFNLSWNLVPRLIWISRIQWWCLFYIFGQFLSKNQNYEFKRKFFTKSNSNMQNTVMIFLYLFFCLWSEIYSFWVNLVEKVKIVSVSWNLMLRLIRRCRIQRCCSLFLLLTGNTIFVQFWSKYSKQFFNVKFDTYNQKIFNANSSFHVK